MYILPIPEPDPWHIFVNRPENKNRTLNEVKNEWMLRRYQYELYFQNYVQSNWGQQAKGGATDRMITELSSENYLTDEEGNIITDEFGNPILID